MKKGICLLLVFLLLLSCVSAAFAETDTHYEGFLAVGGDTESNNAPAPEMNPENAPKPEDMPEIPEDMPEIPEGMPELPEAGALPPEGAPEDMPAPEDGPQPPEGAPEDMPEPRMNPEIAPAPEAEAPMDAETWESTYFSTLTSAVMALNRGDIERLQLPINVAKYIQAQNPDLYDITLNSESSPQMALAMAALEENQALLDLLDGVIEKLLAMGTLTALEERFVNDLSVLPTATDLPYIEGARTIRVLVTGDMPPYDYVTADGVAAGYSVALLTFVSRMMGINFELVYADAGSRVINLTSGRVDIIFWVAGICDETGTGYDFSRDVPDGVAISAVYAIQTNACLTLK